MNARLPTPATHGELIEPTTLRMQRLLPGPIERVWNYLLDENLRRQWLAAGKMEARTGSSFEFVWRNDELTQPPGQRPEGFGDEHRMQGRVLACDPPHRLQYSWFDDGDVTIELAQQGDEVLLTLVHRRLTTQNGRLMVGAGWHAHLDILQARLAGTQLPAFWDHWVALRAEYDRRFAA